MRCTPATRLHGEVEEDGDGLPQLGDDHVADVAPVGASVTGPGAGLRAEPEGVPCVDITVSARHTEVSEALHDATIDKIGRLVRFLEGMDRAEVHFAEERNPRILDREVCEVTLEGHGHHVRCKVAAPDGFVALDCAVAKLEQQLHKLKTKLQRRAHGAPKAAARAAVDAVTPAVGADGTVVAPEAPDEPAGLRIVRTKSHALKPVTPDEAAQQMDLLGHGFYFFTNADTGRSAVVYWRDDGDVGLIDEAG